MPHISKATTAEDVSSDDSDDEDGKHGESEEISCPENVADPLTLEDTLYGYTPDEGYGPNSMEEFDGENVGENKIESSDFNNLESTLESFGNELVDEEFPMYDGDGPCLCPRAESRFETLLGACGVAGGLTYSLIKRITANSNSYVRAKMKGTKWYGSDWRPIRTEEMYWTLGMVLKMSMIQICYGGIRECFIPWNKIYPSCNHPIDLKGIHTNGWTHSDFTYGRFLKICAALHPEMGNQQWVINAINYVHPFSHSTAQQGELSFQGGNFHLMKARYLQSPDIIQYDNTILTSLINIGSISLCLQMLPQAIISFITSTFTKERMQQMHVFTMTHFLFHPLRRQ